MPMYDYKCTKCEHTEEYFHNMDNIPESHRCPECQCKMERVFAYAAPIHFSSDFKEDNKIRYDKSPSGRKRFY